MNKKTIITILLAIVTVAGQAQVKSSLDLCLRDEVTGEWLIGLFERLRILELRRSGQRPCSADEGRTAKGSAIEEECRYYRRE